MRDHKLFDRGAFTVSPEFHIQESDRAHGTQGFTEWLAAYHGKRLRPPQCPSYHPEPALREKQVTDQVTDQVSDQVLKLLRAIGNEMLDAVKLMNKLGLSHRPSFRKNYLHPSLNAGYIEMTIPEKPRSSKQRYRITSLGRRVLDMTKERNPV